MMKLTTRTDRSLIRVGARSVRYVLATVTAPKSASTRERPGLHAAFVLDRSGSMGGSKIQLAKEAIQKALWMLDERDRFSVVVYDDRVDVVMPSTVATPEARRTAMERIAEVDARGTTDLAGGWLRGIEQITADEFPDLVQRCLLLTDGLANVGITDPDELERHATELRTRGVRTTTFGIGADFDEHLLQRMATGGGGNFYFIETAAQIPDFLASEIGEALEVVAKDVRIVVNAPGVLGVEAMTPVIRRQERGGTWRFDMGDLVSRQEVQPLFRVEFPLGREGEAIEASFSVDAGEGEMSSEASEIRWSYASHRANDDQPRDSLVDRRVAAIYAARARQEAMEHNRHGRYDEASRRLGSVAARIRSYAGADAGMLAEVSSLERESVEVTVQLDSMDRKSRHFASRLVMESKRAGGRARRSGDQD